MKQNTIVVNTGTIKNNLMYDGINVLTYTIEYPQFESSKYRMQLAVLNKGYRAKALKYRRYLEGELYPTAVKQYINAKKNNFPVLTFEALGTYTVTYNDSCILSLYFDRYEYTGGAHGSTVRYSDTWNLQKPARIRLDMIINCSYGYKEYIFNEACSQIEQDPGIYFEDYKKLLARTFSKNSFYVTPKGVVVFYQHYDIAPYSSGIREFIIPYSPCVHDPKSTCRPQL